MQEEGNEPVNLMFPVKWEILYSAFTSQSFCFSNILQSNTKIICLQILMSDEKIINTRATTSVK